MTLQIRQQNALQRIDFAWMEICRKCNRQCPRICYNNSGPKVSEMMSLEDGISAIDQLSALGCKMVQFIGGEPTLNKALGAFIRHAHSLGFTFIEVYTNGIVMPKDQFDLIVELGVHVAVSFHSHVASEHDAVMGKKGSYDKTLATFKRLIEANVPLRANIVETEDNPGSSAETIAFLNALGVSHVGYDKARPFGRADFLGNKQDPCDGLCGQCGNRKVCITSTGAVMGCIMARDESLLIGNMRDGLANVLASGRLHKVRERIMETVIANRECDPNCGPNGDCQPHNAQPGMHDFSRLGAGAYGNSINVEATTDQSCDPYNPCSPVNCQPAVCNPDVPCRPTSVTSLTAYGQQLALDPCAPETLPPCGPDLLDSAAARDINGRPCIPQCSPYCAPVVNCKPYNPGLQASCPPTCNPGCNPNCAPGNCLPGTQCGPTSLAPDEICHPQVTTLQAPIDGAHKHA